MQRMCWVRRFEYAAVLFTFLLFQLAVGNEISEPDLGQSYICSCIIDDKMYNLAPLKSRDGSPRFNASGSDKYMYSYNPCQTFRLGPPSNNSCYFRDVAICRWNRRASKFQNIGKQSTASCGFNTDTRSPQLLYQNSKLYPSLTATINFKCDPSLKRIKDAKFEIIHDNWPAAMTFQVTHKCACPNGCQPSRLTDEQIYMIFGALSVVAIAGPLIVYFCTKRYDRHQHQPLHREQNEADNDGRRHGRNDDFDDCRDNVVPDHLEHQEEEDDEVNFHNKFCATSNEGAAIANDNNLNSLIRSQRSYSNISRPNKDDFNIRSKKHYCKQ